MRLVLNVDFVEEPNIFEKGEAADEYKQKTVGKLSPFSTTHLDYKLKSINNTGTMPIQSEETTLHH